MLKPRVIRLGSGLKRQSQRNESANRGQRKSIRRVAKELGISPAYLSYMINGKRPWRKDLYQRYMGAVNTFVNSEASGPDSATEEPYRDRAASSSFEIGAGRGTRTHTPAKVADLSLL